jgi:hypothetical protein
VPLSTPAVFELEAVNGLRISATVAQPLADATLPNFPLQP